MPEKKADLRNLTKDELGVKLSGFKTELFNLTYQAETGRIEKPHRVKQIRKEIARINTILREQEIKNAGKPRQA
ncbi:MAG: 50S ribosomal protein L29 [Candidatus Omnitrophica bacterium]|nr:50S ribosomal protein L29 [Candidatus Omnitrophota bacterium]